MGITALVGAGISAGASFLGSQTQAKASKQAAAAQLIASQQAIAEQDKMFGQTQANIAPYLATGSAAAGDLSNRLTDLTTPINFNAPTEAEAAATPGFQFTLNNGLKATQSSAAARGLGLSGAALKGAANYSTGLANSTYNDVFNRAQTGWQDATANQNNSFNKLYSAASLGASAAGAQGQIGAYTGNNIANNINTGGAAAASGINAAGSATTAGIAGVGSALNNALQQYAIQNPGSLNKLLSATTTGLYTGGNASPYVDQFGSSWS